MGRRHGRLVFREPVNGDVTATHEVRIADLSLSGARLEHTAILRPGNTCYLRNHLRGQPLTLICRIVWSTAVARSREESRGQLLFHSGLEFEALAQDAQRVLDEFLKARSASPGNGGTPAWVEPAT